jgi:hypothetical protein
MTAEDIGNSLSLSFLHVSCAFITPLLSKGCKFLRYHFRSLSRDKEMIDEVADQLLDVIAALEQEMRCLVMPLLSS